MNNHPAALLLLAGVAAPILSPLHAQLVADGSSLTINGTTTNIVGSLIVGNSVAGTAEGVTNYTHVGGATNGVAFYRIRLEP